MKSKLPNICITFTKVNTVNSNETIVCVHDFN